MCIPEETGEGLKAALNPWGGHRESMDIKAADAAKAKTASDLANRTYGFGIAPPEAAPDVTDTKVRARKYAQAMQLMSGRGRKETFMGAEGMGDYKVGRSMLGGG